jgi:hypothetical protein
VLLTSWAAAPRWLAGIDAEPVDWYSITYRVVTIAFT